MFKQRHLARRPLPQVRPNTYEPIDLDLNLVPRTRRPLELARETCGRVLARPVPAVDALGGPPVASILVPVLDNLVCTRLAVESVLASTDVPYELVIIDNGSEPATQEYLSAFASRNSHVRVLRNDHNVGFAPAVNQGLVAARGEVLVLLNNDTIVTPGWLGGLIEYLADREIGLIGPTTNRCGNAAEVATSYRTYGELVRDAAATRSTSPIAFDLPVAMMFCVAFRREVLEQVGVLDERFAIGTFEDDDYSRRVQQAGLRVACAPDVFVHHFGQATLGDPRKVEDYGRRFHENRQKFEQKWAEPWTPHSRRVDPSYELMTERVRDVVADTTRPGAVVVVISRGDDELLTFAGRSGWHFARLADGTSSGSHPADSREAIESLEQLRMLGAEYLVVPESSSWWLDHYTEFAQHIRDHYRCAASRPGTAVIFDLEGGTRHGRTAITHAVRGPR